MFTIDPSRLRVTIKELELFTPSVQEVNIATCSQTLYLQHNEVIDKGSGYVR